MTLLEGLVVLSTPHPQREALFAIEENACYYRKQYERLHRTYFNAFPFSENQDGDSDDGPALAKGKGIAKANAKAAPKSRKHSIAATAVAAPFSSANDADDEDASKDTLMERKEPQAHGLVICVGLLSAQKLFFNRADAEPRGLTTLVSDSDWFATIHAGIKTETSSYEKITSKHPESPVKEWLSPGDNFKGSTPTYNRVIHSLVYRFKPFRSCLFVSFFFFSLFSKKKIGGSSYPIPQLLLFH